MGLNVVRWLIARDEPGCYMSVPYIRVEGSNREIGRALAEFGRAEYGISELGEYTASRYARARFAYYKRNWREMAERVRGVADEFGIQPESSDLDPSALVYDMAPSTTGPIGMGCSAIFMPGRLNETKGPIIARNFDAWRVTPAGSRLFSNVGPEQRPLYSRSLVIEYRPSSGIPVIALGGHDLLFPFQDAMNGAGLFITSLADLVPPISKHMSMAGGENSGLSSRQLLLLIASRCRTVEQARELVLAHQVRQDFALHWLIADRHGDATVLELDEHGCFVFNDASSSGDPLFVTNHQVNADGAARARASYKRLLERRPGNRAYDSIVRLEALQMAHSTHPQNKMYSRQDIERKMIDSTVCSYADYAQAGINEHLKTRTIWSIIAEPKRKQLEVRLYLHDCEDRPVRDNRAAIAWRRWRLGFDRDPELISAEEITEEGKA